MLSDQQKASLVDAYKHIASRFEKDDKFAIIIAVVEKAPDNTIDIQTQTHGLNDLKPMGLCVLGQAIIKDFDAPVSTISTANLKT